MLSLSVPGQVGLPLERPGPGILLLEGLKNTSLVHDYGRLRQGLPISSVRVPEAEIDLCWVKYLLNDYFVRYVTISRGVQVTLNEVLQGILPILFLFPQKSGIHDWAGHYIIASLFVMCCWKVLP